MGRDLFRAVAPRLELAHRQRQQELEILSRRRRAARKEVLKWQYLVAHRELQLIRSESTNRAKRDGRYMRGRHNKLQTARRELRRAEKAEQAAIAAKFID